MRCLSIWWLHLLFFLNQIRKIIRTLSCFLNRRWMHSRKLFLFIWVTCRFYYTFSLVEALNRMILVNERIVVAMIYLWIKGKIRIEERLGGSLITAVSILLNTVLRATSFKFINIRWILKWSFVVRIFLSMTWVNNWRYSGLLRKVAGTRIVNVIQLIFARILIFAIRAPTCLSLKIFLEISPWFTWNFMFSFRSWMETSM